MQNNPLKSLGLFGYLCVQQNKLESTGKDFLKIKQQQLPNYVQRR